MIDKELTKQNDKKDWVAQSVPERTATFRDLLNSNRDAIAQTMPKHVSTDRLIKIALQAATINPKLLQCSRVSLINSVMQCASLGLEPNSAMGHIYIIPFKDKATVIIGYKGFLELARRSDRILSVEAQLVYENDEYEFRYGTETEIKHVPAFALKPPKERGKLILGYSVVKIKDSEPLIDVMSFNDLEDRRKASLSKDGNIWKKWPAEMYKKTLIRHGLKYAPITIEISDAFDIDNNDTGELKTISADIVNEMTGEVQADYEELEPKSKSESMAEKLNGKDK